LIVVRHPPSQSAATLFWCGTLLCAPVIYSYRSVCSRAPSGGAPNLCLPVTLSTAATPYLPSLILCFLLSFFALTSAFLTRNYVFRSFHLFCPGRSRAERQVPWCAHLWSKTISCSFVGLLYSPSIQQQSLTLFLPPYFVRAVTVFFQSIRSFSMWTFLSVDDG